MDAASKESQATRLKTILALSGAGMLLCGAMTAQRYSSIKTRRQHTSSSNGHTVKSPASAIKISRTDKSDPVFTFREVAADGKPTAPEARGETQLRNILFTFNDFKSKKVQITGDFNDWKPVDMNKEKSGTWRLPVALKPGVYRYNFIADGKKKLDTYNSNKEAGSSILVVEPANLIR
ncbi:MAG: glycogen-binding domain-containing protein [Elusimicrobiota bacterium]